MNDTASGRRLRLRSPTIYTLGLIPLALVYYEWKRVAPNEVVSFGAIIVYVLLLRVLAIRFGRR